MRFGEKLRKLRRDQGLSQEDVANALGISRRAYIAYEKNDVRPRKMESYDKLSRILLCDKNYLLTDDESDGGSDQTGFQIGAKSLAGIAIATAGGVLAGGLPLAALVFASTGAMAFARETKRFLGKGNKKLEEEIRTYESNQKRFQKMALACIMTKLTQTGIAHRQVNIEDMNLGEGGPDECLVIEKENKTSWWLAFYSMDDKKKILDTKQLSEALLRRFILVPSDPSRVISFVVDDKELYDSLVAYKGNYSYKGDVSVILIDAELVDVEAEETIANYDDGNSFGIKLLK